MSTMKMTLMVGVKWNTLDLAAEVSAEFKLLKESLDLSSGVSRGIIVEMFWIVVDKMASSPLWSR